MTKRQLLTDAAVRKAKPDTTPYRLADGGGLFLYIAPSGVRSWQFRYRHAGRPQTATLGRYPTMTLEGARKEAEIARSAANEGKHLTTEKRVRKARKASAAAATFAAVAKSWVADQSRAAEWSAKHCSQVEASLRIHLWKLDTLPVSTITAQITKPIIDAVKRQAPMMAEKVEPRLHSILDHAVQSGLIERNPLPRPPRTKRTKKHYPAVVDLPGVGEILRLAEATECGRGVARAHLLLVFTGLRVSEVVGARWTEFDLNAALWAVPRDRMKIKDPERGPHVVPLPPRLLAKLREWRRADSAAAHFVAPSPKLDRHITPEAAEKHYREVLHLRGKHSPHSWRSAFTTIATEAGRDEEVIFAQLDHANRSKVKAAYVREKRLELRISLMRWYETTLIAARDGADVVPMPRRKA